MIENAGWLSVAAMLVGLAFLVVLFQRRPLLVENFRKELTHRVIAHRSE